MIRETIQARWRAYWEPRMPPRDTPDDELPAYWWPRRRRRVRIRDLRRLREDHPAMPPTLLERWRDYVDRRFGKRLW